MNHCPAPWPFDRSKQSVYRHPAIPIGLHPGRGGVPHPGEVPFINSLLTAPRAFLGRGDAHISNGGRVRRRLHRWFFRRPRCNQSMSTRPNWNWERLFCHGPLNPSRRAATGVLNHVGNLSNAARQWRKYFMRSPRTARRTTFCHQVLGSPAGIIAPFFSPPPGSEVEGSLRVLTPIGAGMSTIVPKR